MRSELQKRKCNSSSDAAKRINVFRVESTEDITRMPFAQVMKKYVFFETPRQPLKNFPAVDFAEKSLKYSFLRNTS